mgnify:CR=1 FL=1|jgi:hypothetical protein
MDREEEERLIEFVEQLDETIGDFTDFEAHNIAGVLLSRVVLLMQDNPEIGKELVRYVWERLDEIEQADPGNML